MKSLEIILLPFTFIYKGFITIVLLPYYAVVGIIKLFSNKGIESKTIKENKVIAEIKPGEPVMVIKEIRSAYEEPKVKEPETDPVKIKEAKELEILKKQNDYSKIVEKARIEEEKRLKAQEKFIADMLAKENLEKAKREEKKKLEEAAATQKAAELSEIERLKKSGNSADLAKARSKEKKLSNKQRLEYEAKKEIMLEQFKNSKDTVARLSKPLLFNYIARNADGIVEKSGIEALSRMDVYSFLLAEGYDVYEIVAAKPSENITIGNFKFKTSKLIFYLSQLSAYLKSGIALADSVKILEQQAKALNEKKVWRAVYYDLSMGDVLSLALEKRKTTFPKLLVNMIKTAEMTGNLSETLDDMVEYYTEIDNTKKQMKSALTYPAVILTFAVIVVTFILVYIVPQFAGIYDTLGSEVPKITKITMALSDFLGKYLYVIILVICAVVIILALAYKNVKSIKKVLQEIAMHVPIFGDIIIYNEVTVFTKTFANLINHNVFITNSMDVLAKVTNNEVYKELILKSAKNLTKGDTLSMAFKDNWAFPNIAYQMLITGEKTGRLGPMMEKVSQYYQEQHRNIINQMKALIEPVLIVSLAVVVGFVLISVVIPMFSMYESIQ